MINRGLRGRFARRSACAFAAMACAVTLPAQLSAADYYMLPTGVGSQNGSSWANALPKSAMSTTLNTTMAAGDTLNLGSGAYGNTTIPIASNGTAGNRKTVRGVDTGGGLPVFETNNWVRTNPDSGQWSIISAEGNHWNIQDLILREAQYAVRINNAHTDITFSNITIERSRHGFYILHTDNLVLEDCVVRTYTKHGFRLDQGCDNVTLTGCVADLSDGDSTWWDYAEAYPFGFIVNSSGTANTNVAFINCTANNNRWNNQTSSSYWNGDGFVVEGNTVGVSFTGCVAVNNEDGGYDIKPAATFEDCVSVKNYRGFRLWNTTKTLTNCVATFPFRRSTGNPTGVEGGAGVWYQNGTSTLDFFTFHANAGTGIHDDGTGSSTLTNSILSFTGAGGTFSTGSTTLGSGTVTYRPGSGTNPSFVNAVSTWDGMGNDMDSQTYGATKGYHWSSVLLTDLAPTDDAHVRYGNYANSNYGASQTLEIRNTGVNYRRYIFLRFDLSSLSGNIDNATLNIYCSSATAPDTHSLSWVTNDSWAEGTVTGANYASGTATGVASYTPAAGTMYSIDVTDEIAAQAAGDGVITFRLISTKYESVQGGYASKENATVANRPVLSVTTSP